ncbi:MAG: restriction endonuclease [Elusimicrobia bacterium]|nr:restriction endonuclease [Elusimicrobiota bacterium]
MTRFGLALIRFVSRLPWPIGAAVSAAGIAVVLAGFLALPRQNLLLFCGIAAALLGSVSAVIAFVEPKPQARSSRTLTGPESLRELGLEDFQSVVSGAYGRLGYDIFDNPEGGGLRGVDIRLHKGGKLTLVQTKHWREDITPAMVKELCGAVAADQAAQGIMVTTAGISPEARASAQGGPIELLDGPAVWKLVGGGAG